MTPAPATPAGTNTPAALQDLPAEGHSRLQQLARRYRIRADTTLRPVADVVYDLRSRHGLQLSMGQVFELLRDKAAR
jgi:hypothetical protein